jgi:ADP-ribosylglycohydrolase
MLVTGWDTPLKQLSLEIEQLEFEGFSVPQAAKDALAQLDHSRDAYDESKLLPIQSMLCNLQRSPNFSYVQPDDWENIQLQRKKQTHLTNLPWDERKLLDKFHGAWTGRAVGCALGKPVEMLGLTGHAGLNGRMAIKEHLKRLGDWELRDYFSGKDVGDGIKLNCQNSWRENISFMEPDDDIHYSLIGLKVLEEFGPEFEWFDVANTWNNSLPYGSICTAETQAILNYNMATPRSALWGERSKMPIQSSSFTARNNNPYREWIGAQIRADGWAYCSAGDPHRAAEFAWRDAHWTHTANGIYGEMFTAAMISAAFTTADPLEIIRIGLSEIPARSKLAEGVEWALSRFPLCPDFESFMTEMEEKYKGMNTVHTINNALIVVMSLYYGKGDPERSICIAVMAGMDTDCNGATVGSIVGALCGRSGFTGKMASRLNDTIKPLVFGFQEIKMEELARRTMAVWKKIQGRKSA